MPREPFSRTFIFCFASYLTCGLRFRVRMMSPTPSLRRVRPRGRAPVGRARAKSGDRRIAFGLLKLLYGLLYGIRDPTNIAFMRVMYPAGYIPVARTSLYP